MRRRWADPEARQRMMANLERGRGWNRGRRHGDPPDPPAPPADPSSAPPPAAPPADPPEDPPKSRRNPAAAVLTASPRDLIDWLRGR